MDSITYKCPNCGGGLVFEPETQKFKCGYCLSVFTEEELKKMTPDSQSASEAQTTPETQSASETQMTSEAQTTSEASQTETPMMVYTCPSCGAELVTDDTTASTFCYYCHNPVVLSGKLEGAYRPDCVIPFEMDKKKAEEIFKSWISKKKYVPKDFYSPKQMERLEGIYYPYWLYDCKVDGTIAADATKRNITQTGAIEYTETSRFKIERQGTMDVKNVTRNALKKADHQLAEGVLPFDMEKIHSFEAGYLSGFKAERRDREKEEFDGEVQAEVKEFAVTELQNSITASYDHVTVQEHEEKILSSEWKYGMFPVWVLTYKDKGHGDKLYYFAMNGQSGKICGVLPVDYKRLAVLFSAVFFPLFILCLIGGYFI
ncbi:MAG: TFIIB-type zinc ribbon-containing protein [Clostridium sp.]